VHDALCAGYVMLAGLLIGIPFAIKLPGMIHVRSFASLFIAACIRSSSSHSITRPVATKPRIYSLETIAEPSLCKCRHCKVA